MKLQSYSSTLESCLGTEYLALESHGVLERWCKHTVRLLLEALIPSKRGFLP